MSRAVSITSRTVKTYTVTLDGTEARPCQYTSAGRQYRPDRAEVVKQDGNVSSVILSGPVLKKDGSDGANWHDERMWNVAECPAWLLSIIAGLA